MERSVLDLILVGVASVGASASRPVRASVRRGGPNSRGGKREHTFLFEPGSEAKARHDVRSLCALGAQTHTMSGEVGVPDQDVLEQELEELLRCARGRRLLLTRRDSIIACALSVWRLCLAGTMRR